MTRNLLLGGVEVFLICLVAACTTTEYRYTPPTSRKGEACVERCQARQQSCRDDETSRAESSKAQCERDSQTEYDACLKYSSDRKKCYQKGCYDFASTAQCDSDFRACYQNCGGRIDIMTQ